MIAGLANHTILIRKDLTEMPIDDSGAPIKNDEGTIVGAVLVFRDISERKRAQQEQQRLQQQLRYAQKMEALGTLSGGIAHDFNNILAAIIGFTELVADNAKKGSPDERHLKRILEASLRGRDLVKQMLTFSSKTEQAMKQTKKPFQLRRLINDTFPLIRAATPTTINIRVNAPSQSLIFGDPGQIQQLLMNLYTNATHAMREKGGALDIDLTDVRIDTENPQGMAPGLYVKLVVRDTGAGIPPDIIDRIFDPFFTTKGLGPGTGLGLSVVHGIVRQSKGYITVESEFGKGSTFIVYLPTIAGKVETEPTDDAALPSGDERILFIDDEEALAEMGEGILSELGYRVTSRTDAGDALSLLKEDPSRFDLVITDQTMPNMTGIELARQIFALRPGMPVILCTGFSQLVDADKAKAAGISAFEMKPLTKREIARTIRNVLDG